MIADWELTTICLYYRKPIAIIHPFAYLENNDGEAESDDYDNADYELEAGI